MAYKIPIMSMTMSQQSTPRRVIATADWTLVDSRYEGTRPRWIQFCGMRTTSFTNTDWYGERTVVAHVTLYHGTGLGFNLNPTTFIVKGKATVAPAIESGKIACFYNFSLSGAPPTQVGAVRMEFDIMDSLPYRVMGAAGVAYTWAAGSGEYVLYASDRADMTSNDV